MKHLATFEAAAQTIGLDPAQLPIVSHLPESMQKAPVALFKLSVISAAAWQESGIKLDWNNRSQEKYFAWWKMRSEDESVGSASGFSVFAATATLSRIRASAPASYFQQEKRWSTSLKRTMIYTEIST
ncbi:hypothetical protein [Sphingobacterium multivorum]|uniref:hypothetical protein n=1 Tax=Sphingobacterium multivorum TaxID=28454 RepID=UPI0036868EFF